MKTFLVTGGCGFIGSHLCDALRRAGHAVRVLDDLSTGRTENLAAGAELIRGDAGDPAKLRAALDGVDGCFHLAAIASVERGVTEWLTTHRTNLGATVALFDEIRRQGRRVPVVYASSAAVYGETPPPLAETAPARPLSAYGADKYGCELHARVASEVHGIPTVGLRFFNVYGPRQDPASPYSGVISIFCDRLRRGEPIDIYGDGGQTRDFVFVSDVVNAALQAMERLPAGAPAFNICAGRPVSVIELARMIAALCGREPDIRRAPARLGEVPHSYGKADAAHDALGVRAVVPLREGLAEVLRWLAVEAQEEAACSVRR